MRRIFLIILVLGFFGGGYFSLEQFYPEWSKTVLSAVSNDTFYTLEMRYTPQQIMDVQKNHLLISKHHRYNSHGVKFSPYVMMDVKYLSDPYETGEGIILWDLVDGEMVLGDQEWEKTHGFKDCIKAHVQKDEFRILNVLAERGGFVDRKTIAASLLLEDDVLESWIDRCRKKKLIVQHGNYYRLHLHKPRLHVIPETKIKDRIVTLNTTATGKVPRRFSPGQIMRVAKAAFGQDFAVQSYRVVFLPVCEIVVENPDGTTHTSYWNTVNGRQISLLP